MEETRGLIEPGALVELLWRQKWRVVLTGFICCALVSVAASGLPIRYFASGLLIPESAPLRSGEPSDRPTQTDILLSPTLLGRTADQLGLAHNPSFFPKFHYAPLLTNLWDSTSGVRQTIISYLKPDNGSGRSAQTNPDNGVLRYLRSHISVTGSDNSRVLTIGAEAGTPELSAAVVNELMRQYIDRDLESRRAIADDAYQQLQRRAESIKQEADAADLKVQQFQQQNHVMTLSAGAPAALQFSAQQAQLASAKLDLAQAEASLDASRQGPLSLSSPTLQALDDRETDVLQRIARTGEAGSLNPRRLALDDELRAVRAQIGAESRKVSTNLVRNVDIARRRVAALQSSVSGSQSDANGAGNAQLTLAQLTRDADAKRGMYQTLIARAEDARVATTQLAAAQIVSPAVPPVESEPSRSLIFCIFGFIAGILLAIVAILIRNSLWARVSSAKSLATITGMPSLGSLPRLRGLRALSMPDLAVNDGGSAIAETLRGMRLTMQNMVWSDGGTTILVTSALAGEGKTTVAASFARRASGDGLRVLLVEADLRRPGLRDVLGLSSSPDLESSLLRGSSLEAMVQVDPQSGLHCIVARGNHPNPVSLLSSERFKSMIAQARKTYDLVVIDSPPALRVTDPIFLSQWADIILFAVRAEDTAQTLVVEALKRFPKRCQERVVTLITRAKTSQSKREGYFAGYGAWQEDRSATVVTLPPARIGHDRSNIQSASSD